MWVIRWQSISGLAHVGPTICQGTKQHGAHQVAHLRLSWGHRISVYWETAAEPYGSTTGDSRDSSQIHGSNTNDLECSTARGSTTNRPGDLITIHTEGRPNLETSKAHIMQVAQVSGTVLCGAETGRVANFRSPGLCRSLI